MNFVLSGFINKSFVQHQVATLRKSSSSLNLASMTSATEKDSKTLESSTYDSSWQNWGAPGGLRVWLVMDLIAQNRYALIGSGLKGSCGTTELQRVRHLQRRASGVTSDGKYCRKPLRGRVGLMHLFPFFFFFFDYVFYLFLYFSRCHWC